MATDPISTASLQSALAQALRTRASRPVARTQAPDPTEQAARRTPKAQESRAYTPRGTHLNIIV